MTLDSSARGPVTYCDKLATTQWGRYIVGVEGTALRTALSWQPPGAALEIGCEGGRWSRMLADAGWSLTCVDVDADALAVCHARIPSARCVLASERDKTLPCGDGSVQLLLCIEVWPVMDADWFLPEAHRVLAPGGLLVGVIMNRTSLRGLFVRSRERMTDANGFRHYRHSYASWRRGLASQGFRVRYERGYCWFPFSRASDLSVIPAFTAVESALSLPRLPSLSPYVVFVAQRD